MKDKLKLISRQESADSTGIKVKDFVYQTPNARLRKQISVSLADTVPLEAPLRLLPANEEIGGKALRKFSFDDDFEFEGAVVASPNQSSPLNNQQSLCIDKKVSANVFLDKQKQPTSTLLGGVFPIGLAEQGDLESAVQEANLKMDPS